MELIVKSTMGSKLIGLVCCGFATRTEDPVFALFGVTMKFEAAANLRPLFSKNCIREASPLVACIAKLSPSRARVFTCTITPPKSICDRPEARSLLFKS